MKKLLSAALCAVILLTLVPLCVSADGATATLGASGATVSKNGTIDVYYTLENNVDVVGSFQCTVFYDQEAFEYVEDSLDSDYFAEFPPNVKDDGTLRCAQSGGVSSADSGKLIKLSFKPTEAAEIGHEYEFGIGSKGRTTLYVTSSGGTNGDIISSPECEEGLILETVKVKVVREYTVKYTDGVSGITVFQNKVFTVAEGGATPSFGANPSRSGYAFDGWTPELSDTVTGNITYTAKWKALQKFSVTYTDGVDDEIVFANQIYNVTENSQTPAFSGTLERIGYVFDGWTPAVSSKVTGNVTYTAKWVEAEKYSVTYTDGTEDGSGFENQVFYAKEGEDTPVFVGTPERTGYVFKGWNPEVSDTVSGNITYTAIWEGLISYAVVYTDGVEDEQVFPDQSKTVFSGEDTPEFVGTPERAGYIFKGWNPEVTDKVTAGITYTAKWEKIYTPPKYTVIYTDGIDGEQIFADQSDSILAGSATPGFLGQIERTGYTFKGWNPEVADKVTANVTYTAVWEKNVSGQTYTVKYSSGVEDGSSFDDRSFDTASGSVTPAFEGTPERTGYIFRGWNPEVADKVTANVTYTAIWEKLPEPKKYIVKYTDGIDGKELFADQTYKLTEGSQTPAFDGTPERSGYTFRGWNPEVSGEVTASVTYTAVWEKNAPSVPVAEYTVTYTDGVPDEEIFPDKTFTVEDGDPTPGFGAIPERAGYDFKGWNPVVSDVVTLNVTYTANWEKHKEDNVCPGEGCDCEECFCNLPWCCGGGNRCICPWCRIIPIAIAFVLVAGGTVLVLWLKNKKADKSGDGTAISTVGKPEGAETVGTETKDGKDEE